VSFSRVEDARLRFLVADTGPGIRRKDFDRVFLPFERLEVEGEAERPAGAGLGLAVSKVLIEAMGGTVGIERSVRGRGTTFYAELELLEPPSNAHEIIFDTTTSVESEPPRLHGRVLYIEDSLENLELLELALRGAGDVTLIPAARGAVGLQRAAELSPDLILLDLHLPDMPGAKVLTKLKQDPRTSHIPVLVVSADATQRQIRRMRAAGAVDYLTKPLDLVELLDAMRAALEPVDGDRAT
jgi:CheY-like chemotaxis protein